MSVIIPQIRGSEAQYFRDQIRKLVIMFSLLYSHLRPRIIVFSLPENEPFVSRRSPPCFSRTQKRQNKTLAPKRLFRSVTFFTNGLNATKSRKRGAQRHNVPPGAPQDVNLVHGNNLCRAMSLFPVTITPFHPFVTLTCTV